MKKLIFVFAALVIVVLFIIWGSVRSGDSLTLRQAPQNEKIYIGVYEPLSGYNATGGKQELLGLEYARAVRPHVTVNGKVYDLEFVIADNESEAEAAKLAADSLADSKVSAVFGSYDCAMAAIGNAVFSNAGLPVFGISCTAALPSDGSGAYFSLPFTDAFQGSVLANFAHGRGLRTAAILTQAGDVYSRGLGEYFKAEFEKLGGTAAFYSFNSVQMNFADLIDAIADSRADCIFMPSPSHNAAVFIAQARDAGVTMPVIGGDSWDTQTLAAFLGESGTEVYFSACYSSDDRSNSRGTSFASKFSSWVARSDARVEQNGGSSYASSVSALSYDAYMMLCNAIEAGASSKPADIAAQLKTMSYTGATGKISFSASPVRKMTAYIKTIDISKGRFKLVHTYIS